MSFALQSPEYQDRQRKLQIAIPRAEVDGNRELPEDVHPR